MLNHHQQTVDMLHQQFAIDPEVLALLIIGSTARGDAHPESDVDFVLVVTPEEFDRHRRGQSLHLNLPDLAVPPCAGANGDRVDLEYLHAAAEHGPEPARYAFLDAKLVFTREPEIAALVAQIPVYPERERLEKMRSFYSQLRMAFWTMERAHYSHNPFLLHEAAVKLVLFGGRLILAHNRLLFPNRKRLLHALRAAPDKPAEFIPLALDVLDQPGIPTANEFLQAILHHADWPLPREGWGARYAADSVLHWRAGWCPVEDR